MLFIEIFGWITSMRFGTDITALQLWKKCRNFPNEGRLLRKFDHEGDMMV